MSVTSKYLLIFGAIFLLFKCDKVKKDPKEQIEISDSVNNDELKKSSPSRVEKTETLLSDSKDSYIIYITGLDVEEYPLDKDFHYNEEFMAMSENSLLNYENAKKILRTKSIAQRKKQVVFLSMVNLPFQKKLDLLNYSYELFNEGLLDSTTLNYSIAAPSFDNKPVFFIEYKNKELLNILNKIKSNEKVKDYVKARIDQIISGEMFNRGVKNNWNWGEYTPSS